MSIVSWALRPLGLGTTHSSAPPSARAAGRARRRGAPNAVPVGGHAGDGDDPRPVLGDERRAGGPRRRAARSAVSSDARGVARATRLVMPIPRSTRYRRSSSVIPGAAVDDPVDHPGAQQRRVEAVARDGRSGSSVAAVHRPGLMPTNSSRRPGPTRSGTVASRKASSSARLKPTARRGYGPRAAAANVGRRRPPPRRRAHTMPMSPAARLLTDAARPALRGRHDVLDELLAVDGPRPPTDTAARAPWSVRPASARRPCSTSSPSAPSPTACA